MGRLLFVCILLLCRFLARRIIVRLTATAIIYRSVFNLPLQPHGSAAIRSELRYTGQILPRQKFCLFYEKVILVLCSTLLQDLGTFHSNRLLVFDKLCDIRICKHKVNKGGFCLVAIKRKSVRFVFYKSDALMLRFVSRCGKSRCIVFIFSHLFRTVEI